MRPIPDEGRYLTPEPTKRISEPPTLPSGPTKEENDDNGSARSLTGPDLPSNVYMEAKQEICDAILSIHLQPLNHNYLSIPDIYGILDYIEVRLRQN